MKNNKSIREIRRLLKKRQISVEELVGGYLQKIEKINPKINAFITVNNDALKLARKMDKILSSQKTLPALFGIPISIKDNFLTKDLKTTAASRVLQDYIPPYDATVVERLKKAGAIIIGKTNLDAWAHGSSTETSDFGVTRNPWDRRRVAGGSSGGAAASVVTDMCVSAIGSETAGSIRGPSAWCGCVGLKPTYGRVSRYGLIAMASSLDCPGPITKTVSDSAIILKVIAGFDNYDATTSRERVNDYEKMSLKNLKGIKIAIAQNYLKGVDEEVRKKVYEAGNFFESLKAYVDFAKTLDPSFAIPTYTIIQRSEVSSNLARYDGVRYGKSRSYFGEEAKKRIIIGTFTLSAGYSDKFYKKATQIRTLFINDFKRIFASYDFIISPTMPGPAPLIGESKKFPYFGELADKLSEPAALAGLPAINIPCGFKGKMPLGISIIGPHFSEKKILEIASLYEAGNNFQRELPDYG